MGNRLPGRTTCLYIGLLFAGGGLFLKAQTEELPDAPSAVAGLQPARTTTAKTSTPPNSQSVDWDWPREADLGEEKLLMYQPQLDSWHDDQIALYAALSVEDKTDKKLNYGVV